MDDAVPDCRVTGYEELIEAMRLPDSDARPVPAAAIRDGVRMIVTFNLKDLPAAAVSRFDIGATHPDTFAERRMDLHEGGGDPGGETAPRHPAQPA